MKREFFMMLVSGVVGGITGTAIYETLKEHSRFSASWNLAILIVLFIVYGGYRIAKRK